MTFTANFKLISIVALLTLAVTACKTQSEEVSQPKFFEPFPGAATNNACLFKIALKRPLQVCAINYGVTNQQATNILAKSNQALSAWLQALKKLDDSTHTAAEVKLCQVGADGRVSQAADQYIYMKGGPGVPTSGPGAPLTVYPALPTFGGQPSPLNLPTMLHEFGHSFACLNDTYAGRTAGQCKPGQPNSIMCDNFSFDQLQPDDLAGLKYNYDMHTRGSSVTRTSHTTQPSRTQQNQTVASQNNRCPAGTVFDPARGMCMSCPSNLTYDPASGYCR